MKRLHNGLRLAVLVLVPALTSQATAQSDRIETPLAPGVSYLLITRPGPLQIHVLKVDLSEATAKPAVALGSDRLLQLEPLSGIAARAGRAVPVAGGINGGPGILREDPFRGSPIGLVVADGELVCDPWPAARSAVIFPADGRPRIERLALRGNIAGADGKPLRLGGLNRRRNPGELVLYTPRFSPATRNLDGGRQVVLGGVFAAGDKLAFNKPLKGTVVASVDGKVNVEIPGDGAVVAGSGPAAAWLAARQLGESVTFGFEPVPEVGAVTAALGAGPRLVRDGKVSIEADDEKLSVVLTTGLQPRSAVGFNDAFLYLVAVDGRAAAHSIGMALPQLAQFLIELGCTQAMALDGGGSTTLFVRDRVVNQPSDGLERAIASALLITTTGKLSTAPLPNPVVTGSGVAPETGTTPVAPPGAGGVKRPATRIIVNPPELTLAPGEARQLTVSGEAEDGQPTAVDAAKLSYEVSPAPLGRVDEQGRFKAAKPGSGKITARLGEYAAVVQVKVTGEPDLPSITPGGAKPGDSVPTPVAPVQPGDGVVPKSPSPPTPLAPLPNINPTRPATGNPPKPPAPAAPKPPAPKPPTPATGPPAGAAETRPGVASPAGKRKRIDGFEAADAWTGRTYPESVPGTVERVDSLHYQGKSCLRMEYDFTTTDETRAVYADCKREIGSPKAVSVWVYGDGKGHWLRGSFRDKAGQVHDVDFTDYVNWDHYWARCTAVLPAGIKGPIVWEEFHLVQHRPEVKSAGVIFLDEFEGIY